MNRPGAEDDDSEPRSIRSKTQYDPAIVILDKDRGVKPLDGFHRLWVVARERGEDTILSLVGTDALDRLIKEKPWIHRNTQTGDEIAARLKAWHEKAAQIIAHWSIAVHVEAV